MIKFLPHGKGSGQKAARYLLNSKVHTGKVRSNVEFLRGDPQEVGDLIDTLNFEHRYTSGVIAWAPDDNPTDDQIEDVLDSFQDTALAVLDPGRYDWTAVRHDEPNGGVHIHIVGAMVDLKTGKSLNIAPPGWQNLFGPWCNLWNWQENWCCFSQ